MDPRRFSPHLTHLCVGVRGVPSLFGLKLQAAGEAPPPPCAEASDGGKEKMDVLPSCFCCAVAR